MEGNRSSNNGIRYLTRWKIQLESSDKTMQSVALTEIVELIINADEENIESIYKLLINSDICHFLSEVLIYSYKQSTILINKIVCHLSETHYFFKNEFQKLLRAYLRLINSFSNDNNTRESEYKKDILNTAVIIIKR